MLDDFEVIAGWQAAPAEGVEMRLGQDTGHDAGHEGRALRIDFDFVRGAGYAIARKAFELDFPENYELSFWLKAEAPVNNLEVKLVDASGDNVWWMNRRAYEFPREWRKVRVKKRHLEFAWGPTRERVLRHAAALEIVVTAGTGGKGTVWVDDLTFTPLPVEAEAPGKPEASASSSRGDQRPARAVDGDPATAWLSDTKGGGDGAQWLTLDLLARRELGGLAIDWLGEAPRRFDVELSEDGEAWQLGRAVTAGAGARSYLYLPEAEARFLRVAIREGPAGAGVCEVRLYPPTLGASPAAFFETIARESPRGAYPRSLAGEQVYWTVVGADGDREEGLLSEDGMLETGKASFSIEPFLWLRGAGAAGGELVGWSDVESTPSLAEGYLPIPTVSWKHARVSLAVTAFAAGTAGDSVLYARYRVSNPGTGSLDATLFLALRPFQVNPVAQFLNTPGGVAPIGSLSYDGRWVIVDDRPRVLPLTPPEAFGAAPFESGPLTDCLRRGEVPPAREVEDGFRFASGALAFRLALAPGEARDVDLAVPLSAFRVSAIPLSDQLAIATETWRAKLGGLALTVPPEGTDLADTLRTTLAHVLVNRDGPAIQPGSRAYERSWIRDGALTSSALLRLGQHREVRAFLEWFAPYQFPSGKVPCCVDARGSDPVPENDSHGELIFLVAEHFRFTGDRELAARLWPHVEAAAAYMDELRQSRRTEVYRTGDKRLFFGLLPESISHEGYSAKPMHSYWDDFWALQGFEDAAFLARALGKEAEAAHFTASGEEFRRDLFASLAAAGTHHGIDYLPGCAELGDFDATSTTIALDPVGELERLPRAAVEATFERYWREFAARRDGTAAWEGFTPYELRNVGAFVRLGWRERAWELLEYFLEKRQPVGWNQWPEVVFRERRKPGFLGDLPHTWVGSDFIRSALDLFAYERESDRSVVLAAGIPTLWLDVTRGVGISGLVISQGPLAYNLRRAAGKVVLRIEGGLTPPPGGLVFPWPYAGSPGRTTINGRDAEWRDRELVIRELPAEVVIGE